MLYSNDRKLALSGWLKKNNEVGYNTPLKLQKFLFFYEMFSGNGDKGDFESLQGWKDGPVFSKVYGDYTYRKDEFDKKTEDAFKSNKSIVSENRAEISNFIISIMTPRELSIFSHSFHIWEAKKEAITIEKKMGISLSSDDINEKDNEILNLLMDSYTKEYRDSVEIIVIREKYFLFSKETVSRLSQEQKSTLELLADNEKLVNPVYVDISDSGVLVVD